MPANPRYLSDRSYKRLKRSIKKNPELLSYRELLVYPYADGRYIIIGGNSRYRALVELKYKETPCKVLDKGPRRNLRAALTYKPKTYGSGAMRERLIREYAQQKISREIVEIEIKRRKL